MKISIITPVYKAEKYLERLIDSILCQTYKNFELILVDDGSPDKSGLICDEYAKKDSRITVIHKENGGVSSARQVGLDSATGEYIIHADSDDCVSKFLLEALVQCVNETNADMVIFDFYRVNKEIKELISQKPKSLQYKQVLRDVVGGHLYACCWNKLIKRDVITKYHASFPKGINLGEDKCFLVSLLSNPLSVAYLPKPLYFYDVTVNTGSLVRQITLSSMKDGFAMVSYLEDKLGNEFNDEIYEIKRRLKLRAIESKLYTNSEVNSIYKELNIKLISDVIKLKRHYLSDYVLFFTTLKAVWMIKLLNIISLSLNKIRKYWVRFSHIFLLSL